jgi:hypothetical protein
LAALQGTADDGIGSPTKDHEVQRARASTLNRVGQVHDWAMRRASSKRGYKVRQMTALEDGPGAEGRASTE